MGVDILMSVRVGQRTRMVSFVHSVVGWGVVEWRGQDHALIVNKVVCSLQGKLETNCKPKSECKENVIKNYIYILKNNSWRIVP